MANKISAVNKHETRNYGECSLNNFWKLRQNSDFTQANHRDKIVSLLENINNGFVCICSEELSDKKLIELLFSKAQNLKIYILVNEYSKELDLISGLTLIRFSGLNNIGSFILSNPNSNDPHGLFFGGRLTEGSLQLNHLSGKLNKEEIKELFRHFCYHFWTNAKMEILEKGRQQKIEQKPMDIFYDRDKFSGKDYVYGTLFDFVEKDIRENLSGKRIVYFSQEKQLPTEIKAETEQNLGDNKMKEFFPRDVFENKKPEFTDDGVSVKINFSWQNVPFFLPDNAKVHNIYGDWNKEKEKIEKFLSCRLEDIESLKSKENSLSSKIKRFFLGKKNVLDKNSQKIKCLQKTDFPNISKNELENILKKINDISSEIKTTDVELDKENRKAKIDEEIEKLNKNLVTKNEELAAKKEEIAEKEKDREKTVQDFCKKYPEENLAENKFQEFLNKWKKELESTNKKLKELKEPATDAPEEKKQQFSDDKQLLTQKKEETETNIKELEKLIKTLQEKKQFISKAEGEKTSIIKGIKSLELSIKSKEIDKKNIDQDQSPKSGSVLDAFSKSDKNKQNNNNSKAAQLEIKNLQQLPQTGKLYSFQNQPYLAIENWEDYENGKKEAERFKAKLCAEK